MFRIRFSHQSSPELWPRPVKKLRPLGPASKASHSIYSIGFLPLWKKKSLRIQYPNGLYNNHEVPLPSCTNLLNPTKPCHNRNHDTSTTDHLASITLLIRELASSFIPTTLKYADILQSPPALPRLFPAHNPLYQDDSRRNHTSRMLLYLETTITATILTWFATIVPILGPRFVWIIFAVQAGFRRLHVQ